MLECGTLVGNIRAIRSVMPDLSALLMDEYLARADGCPSGVENLITFEPFL